MEFRFFEQMLLMEHLSTGDIQQLHFPNLKQDTSRPSKSTDGTDFDFLIQCL